MPKLFISYRRRSWGFTHRLADELRERLDADIFVDIANVDKPDFEASIVHHLRESDAMLLVVTELTFADRIHRDDDWVRREIAEALSRDIPIVLVCVEGLLPPPGLPDDIKAVARMQAINFYPDYFTSAVEKLAEFIEIIGAARRIAVPAPSRATATAGAPVSPYTLPDKPATGSAALAEAMRLLDSGDPAKAKFLLDQIAAAGFSSRVIQAEAIARLRQHAGEEITKLERRRRAAIEYEEIMVLVNFRLTEDQGVRAYVQWRQEYADIADQLDTDKTIEMRLEAKAAELLAKGDTLRQQRDFTGAIAAFSEVVKIAPDQANGYLWRGFARQEAGDVDGALADYDHTLALDPENAIAYHVRGQISASRGLLDAAVADFTSAYERDASLRAEFAQLYAEAHLRRAETARKQFGSDLGTHTPQGFRPSDRAAAILDDYNRAVMLAPNLAEVYLARASQLCAITLYTEALPDYDRAIALRPNDASLWIKRGNARRLSGDRPGAHADYAQAIRMEPNNVDAYLSDATLFRTERRWEGVLNHYRTIGHRQHEHHAFHQLALESFWGLAESHAQAQDYAQAAEVYEEAIRFLPDQQSVYWHCSRAYIATGDLPRAVHTLTALLMRWPNDDTAYHQRGLLLDRQGDHEAAIGDYSQAIDIAPSAAALNNRGVARFKVGEIAAAIADFEAALRLQPDYPMAKDNLVMARRRRG